jgi:hypothetical protein
MKFLAGIYQERGKCGYLRVRRSTCIILMRIVEQWAWHNWMVCSFSQHGPFETAVFIMKMKARNPKNPTHVLTSCKNVNCPRRLSWFKWQYFWHVFRTWLIEIAKEILTIPSEVLRGFLQSLQKNTAIIYFIMPRQYFVLYLKSDLLARN